MLTIQNTHNTAAIYADAIDSGTEGMLREFCGLPLSAGSRIRVMPDVHTGKGCVIGMAMMFADRVVPGLIGVDIGCGILAIRLGTRQQHLLFQRCPWGNFLKTQIRLSWTAQGMLEESSGKRKIAYEFSE